MKRFRIIRHSHLHRGVRKGKWNSSRPCNFDRRHWQRRNLTGPYSSDERPLIPIHLPVDGVHEVVDSGVIVPDVDGNPVLHIHASLGRTGKSTTGCLRPGVKTWLVGEVVLQEIIGVSSKQLLDKASGFSLLEP